MPKIILITNLRFINNGTALIIVNTLYNNVLIIGILNCIFHQIKTDLLINDNIRYYKLPIISTIKSLFYQFNGTKYIFNLVILLFT